MELIVVRHGESESNAERRMQGRLDSPLSGKGREQARTLGQFLRERGVGWHAAYTSPLRRARETAEIIAETSGGLAAEPDPDLSEIAAGELEGLNLEEMLERYPSLMKKEITDLGDFSEFGGESYDDVQGRVGRVVERLQHRHREPEHRVLLVAHGGFNFQLVKALICIPVPKVAIVRWGNCSATLLRFRERRGVYMAELRWHLPVELMGGPEGDVSTGLFR